MKVSYNWLNTFFDGKLPDPEGVVQALTFHAWEVEDVEEKNDDTLFDVKVLPDKSAWALSYRGIAKDLSAVISLPLSRDPYLDTVIGGNETPLIEINLASPKCDRYVAGLLTGVAVGPSPDWLVKRLEAIGQRSINNIVDATNYVMFELGEPLHAFDATKLQNRDGVYSIVVRDARAEEVITTLTGESATLSQDDLVIVDGVSGNPIGIVGIKGGNAAAIDEKTKDIIIEAAHFDRVSIRKTSQRLRLRTDASIRFENGISSGVAGIALREVIKLILEIAGGTYVGYTDTAPRIPHQNPVSVSIEKINHVLGLQLSEADVEAIEKRFGVAYKIESGVLTVTPPFERPDLTIPEDLIEEIGRIYGYEHVYARVPDPISLQEINARFYYSEVIREALLDLGFSEVFTSSFRAKDEVKLKNALASDKGYLRSSLRENLHEALLRNAPNADLLGVKHIKIFEIGTIFRMEGESVSLALGVMSPGGYKEKTDAPVLLNVRAKLAEVLGVVLQGENDGGVLETDFDALLKELPPPTAYEKYAPLAEMVYKPFSNYPFVSRDIALWATDASEEAVAGVMREVAGPLLQHLTLFDVFEKEGKTSYAFRLVFQSYEKTLTDAEVNPIMDQITAALVSHGWEVR